MTPRPGRADLPVAVDRLVFGGLAALAFVTLLAFARDMTFRYDEWDFIGNRSLQDPIGLMRPYNEQWVTVPAAIFRAIFAVVGMHSYLPYLVVLLGLHVLVAARVGRLVRFVSGRFGGLVAAALVLFLGVGNENLGQAFQIGMVLATATGFWAIEELVVERRPVAAGLLLLIGLACHAVAAAFLAMALVLALRQSRRALAAILIPLGGAAAWFLVFDLPVMTARAGSFADALPSIPVFVVNGVLGATGAVFGLSTLAGALILVPLVFAAWRWFPRPAHPDLAAAGLVGLIVEYALVAVSRAEFGPESVLWSRYLYVAVPLVLLTAAAWFGPVAAVAAERRRLVGVAIAALAVVAVAGNLRYYINARELTIDAVNQTRAAIAIASWATDVHEWDQDLHLPQPDELRRLLAAHGTPARDDLVPWVVPKVPPDVAEASCRQLIANPDRQADCVAAVAEGVGG